MKKSVIEIEILLLLLCLCAHAVGQVKHKRETSYKRPLQNVKSKDITMEFPCNANATVFLQNIMRKINILTSSDNKVKLITTVYYQGDPSFTDSQWFEKLELSITGSGNNISIKSGEFAKPGMRPGKKTKGSAYRQDTIFNGIATFDSSGNWANRRSSNKQNIVLYVPAGVKLDVDSKYADVTLENNMQEVKARITNGSLTMMDANQLLATSVYGNIYTGNITQAEVDVTNGKVTTKNTGTLNITSKNSSVSLDRVDLLNIRNSQADEFEIEEAKSVTGQKNYGSLRLTTLTGSVNLSGANADIKIRNIDPAVREINITTQYADLRLPVGNLKNYTVAFEGSGGNVYTPFEKTAVTKTSFKASVGNRNEKPTVFTLTCNNCSVDFK